MVLSEEAIAIRVSPPSTTHMRAYMATVGGEPSRSQPPPSDGEEELHLPAGNPNLGGGTLQHLMEGLCQEVTLCEQNAPPRSPPPMP